MYLAGVSVRRVEDITEALWGTRVSPGTVSNLNKKIYAKIDDWRQRRIEGDHPYVFLDGIVMKRSWAGEVRNVSLLVAIGVTTDGYREILGRKSQSSWCIGPENLRIFFCYKELSDSRMGSDANRLYLRAAPI